MKQFFLGLFLLIVAVLIIAGPRGSMSKRTPIEIFPDMDHQPRFKPQDSASFFPDGRASRAEIPGTIAQGQNVMTNEYLLTGRMGANWGDGIPVEVTPALMARGRERYTINCAVCHGDVGNGAGVTAKFGIKAIANYHDERIRVMSDGELFNTITYGKNTMLGYGNAIKPEDRWAIICYLRALQRSQHASVNDVPADLKKELN